MQVEQESYEAGLVVRLTGDFDVNTSPEIRKVLQRHVKQQVPAVIVNMGGVPYIDSSGVATLVLCLREMGQFGGRLVLTCLTEPVKGALAVGELDGVFDIFATEEAAFGEIGA